MHWTHTILPVILFLLVPMDCLSYLCLCVFPYRKVSFSRSATCRPSVSAVIRALWLHVVFSKGPNSPLSFSDCTQLRSEGLSSDTRQTRDASKGLLWVSGMLSQGTCLTCPISAARQSTKADASWRTKCAKAQLWSSPWRDGCWIRKHSGAHHSYYQVNNHLKPQFSECDKLCCKKSKSSVVEEAGGDGNWFL